MNKYPYTGLYHWTEERAKQLAKECSKAHGMYWSYIKGQPGFPGTPNECYALTNDTNNTPVINRATNRRQKCKA